MFESLSLPVLLLIFAGAAVAVWAAGIRLSNTTDVLSKRLHLGSALGGLILLAIATNLPEIAITASAAISGNLGIAKCIIEPHPKQASLPEGQGDVKVAVGGKQAACKPHIRSLCLPICPQNSLSRGRLDVHSGASAT